MLPINHISQYTVLCYLKKNQKDARRRQNLEVIKTF